MLGFGEKNTAAIVQNILFNNNTILKRVPVLGHFYYYYLAVLNWSQRPKSQIITCVSASWNKSLMYNT